MSIPYINAIKSASQQFVKPGDEITYTIVIENKGDTPAINCQLFDEIPCGVIFIPNSVTINGVINPGLNPSTGVSLGTINACSIITVGFKIKVYEDICCRCNNLSSQNVYIYNTATINYQYVPEVGLPLVDKSIQSNTATINIESNCVYAKLDLLKSSSRQYAVVGDIITYTLKASNNGNVPLNEVIITDLLNSNLSFIENSIKIDNITYEGSIFMGINLGAIDVNYTKTITFDARVISVPTEGVISNISNGEFYYNVNSNGNVQSRLGLVESNKNDVYVEKASIKVKKMADKTKVSLNEVITYTVILENDSSVDAISVLFTDKVSPCVSLINGTFTVNNSVINNVNLKTGIVIPIIKARTTTVLTYKVKVVSLNSSLKIINNAHVSFKYSLSDESTGSVDIQDTADSSVEIDMHLSTFKQLNIDTNVSILPQCNCIESVNSIKCEVEILRYHVIQTQLETSNEGQALTGYKLVVYGILKSMIDYTSNNENQSVHVCSSNKPFSEFIILPENYVYGSKIQVTGVTEDVSHTVLSSREVSESVKILLVAKILSC